MSDQFGTCKHCGGQISGTGQYWYHLIINPGSLHIAEPAGAMTTVPVRLPQPRLDAILQPPVQYQVEADGDCLWA